MGHGHSHGGGIPSGSAAARNKGRLARALGLTLTCMLAEVVGGMTVPVEDGALAAESAHLPV
jgi:cobalt-zinc-cadmium efflux system protein